MNAFRFDFGLGLYLPYIVLLALMGGCTSETAPVGEPAEQPLGSSTSAPSPSREGIVFQAEVESNADVPDGLDDLVFLDTSGEQIALKDYLGKKSVVIVFTKGFAGWLCPFCKTQTSRLVANYDKFEQAGAEVLVVYPGTRDHLDEFIEAARTSDKKQVDAVPFPILLDEDFAATDFFNIRASLAQPSTFIIDESGSVRLAYVSTDGTADRPSIQAMLDVLEPANEP